MSRENDTIFYDAVVVGGGPAGRIAALKLAHRGLNTALVADGSPREDGRTTALWQRSINLLRELGVWQVIQNNTAALKKMRMVDATGRLIRAPEVVFDSSEIGEDCFGYNIINSDLNKALQAICEDTTNLDCIDDLAEGIDFGERDVSVTTRSGLAIKALVSVAADGRNSLLRETAQIPVKRWTYPQVALVLNVAHSVPHGSVSTEFHTPTGPYTLVPLPGNRSSIVCVETEKEALRLKSLSAPELALDLEKRSHSILGTLEIVSAPQTFPLSGLSTANVVAPRLALIAETAHVFPPIGAQGLNLSMRDIEDLNSVLAKAKRDAADLGNTDTLLRYENLRLKDIRSRTNAVDLLNRSLLTDLLPVQMARSTGMYMAGKIAPFRRLLMREGMAPGTGIRLPL